MFNNTVPRLNLCAALKLFIVFNVTACHVSQCFSTFVRPRPGKFFFIRRGPRPNKFTRKYLSNFFKFVR